MGGQGVKGVLSGQYVTATVACEVIQAFVPDALPPAPPLEVGHELSERLAPTPREWTCLWCAKPNPLGGLR